MLHTPLQSYFINTVYKCSPKLSWTSCLLKCFFKGIAIVNFHQINVSLSYRIAKDRKLTSALTSQPPPPAFSAHPSHPGVSDQVFAAGAVGHLRHLHHHAYLRGRPGAAHCGLLLHPEVLPGGLQVSVAQVGSEFAYVQFRGLKASFSVSL